MADAVSTFFLAMGEIFALSMAVRMTIFILIVIGLVNHKFQRCSIDVTSSRQQP